MLSNANRYREIFQQYLCREGGSRWKKLVPVGRMQKRESQNLGNSDWLYNEKVLCWIHHVVWRRYRVGSNCSWDWTHHREAWGQISSLAHSTTQTQGCQHSAGPPLWSAKWAFQGKVWNVEGVRFWGQEVLFFFFLWHSQHPIDCSWRFLKCGSILKGSVKFGLTKHFSDQSGHGRFSWPHCYGVNCTPLPTKGVPGGASGTEPACQCRRPKRGGFHPWVGKIPGQGVKIPHASQPKTKT